MARITLREVEQVARLARLALTEAEREEMAGQLNGILAYVETLNRVDTSGVEATTTVIPMATVMREDDA
jgi:aspartyl-tRNA(Asn)/glutamyl-tRNA(Gln) amidotransferase subunit C